MAASIGLPIGAAGVGDLGDELCPPPLKQLVQGGPVAAGREPGQLLRVGAFGHALILAYRPPAMMGA